MPGIREACDEFLQEQHDVYKRAPSRVERDAESARAVTDDHLGRWPLELLQNAEDAHSPEALIRVTDTAVYVADKGKGLVPEAVRSLSGTFLSNKREGIGRKGVGFKSAYEITASPCVFTGADDGVSFDPGLTREWMRRYGLETSSGKIPHQWLPFWVSRKLAEQDDGVLQELAEYQTVVRLPLGKVQTVDPAVAEVRSLTPHVLLTFAHIRRLKVYCPDAGFEITADPEESRPGVWVLRDTRVAAPVSWRVDRREEDTPAAVLSGLDADERQRLKTSSFLVATPVDDAGVVTPASEFLPLYVYYATEQRSPLRMLLHADFVVSSDRKAIIDPARNAVNHWIAERLVDHVIEFVNRAHDRSRPCASIGLLRRHQHLVDHPLANALWESLAQRAKKKLRIPDIKGKQHLSLGKALMISTSVATEAARSILSATPDVVRLVHKQIDQDDDAAAALRELGCAHITDEELVKRLASHAPSRAKDAGWLMVCWQWLAAWVSAKAKLRDEHKGRLERILSLPVLPVGGKCTAISSHEDCIITWRDRSSETGIPSWLPITFVDNWFRDRILRLPEEDPLRTLLSELGIRPPKQDVLLQAFGRAVERYWKNPDKQPGRFTDFLLDKDWHETIDPTPQVQRCPVQADVQDKGEPQWVEASSAYFGRAWGEGSIADLYEGFRGVAWVRPRKSARKDVFRKLCEWLGVQACPRVLKDDSHEAVEAEKARVWPLVNFDYVQAVVALHLDRVDVGHLRPSQSVALLMLLAANWKGYYQDKRTVTVKYTPRSRSYPATVPAAWWHKVKSEWIPPLENNRSRPAPLEKCWLPDVETRECMGDLLPIVKLPDEGEQKTQVAKWLREGAELRSRHEQITVEEWRFLLKERIPEVIGADNLAADQKGRVAVQRWYEAALQSLERQGSSTRFGDTPLLCRRADEWQLVSPPEQRWLEVNTEWSDLFRGDVWQVTFRKEMFKQAEKTFGLKPVATPHLQVEPWPIDSVQECPRLQAALDAIKPYVFAQRCYEGTAKEPAECRARLTDLTVGLAERLGVRVTLEGVVRDKELDYRSGDGRLLIKTGEENPMHLALVLAEYLDVKSDAEFYENLLRCDSDVDRKAKLRKRGSGIPDDQIGRWLHEYGEGAQLPAPEGAPAGGAKIGSGGNGPGGAAVKEEAASTPIQGPKPGVDVPGPHAPRQLKIGESCPYVVAASPPVSVTLGGEGEGAGVKGSSAGGTVGHDMSDEERKDIERRSRQVARRELENQGYKVTEEPFENPGYDLKAQKSGRVLLVEVKGHLRWARKVELTVRQFAEYTRCEQPGVQERWQLWNVENLEDGVEQVVVTSYAVIPETALRERSFLVDLSQCTVAKSDG